MKTHYYFVIAIVTYTDTDFLPKSDKKQVTYEVEQANEQDDRSFFLGLVGHLKRKITKSFLESNTLVEEGKITSVDIKSISKLN